MRRVKLFSFNSNDCPCSKAQAKFDDWQKETGAEILEVKIAGDVNINLAVLYVLPKGDVTYRPANTRTRGIQV